MRVIVAGGRDFDDYNELSFELGTMFANWKRKSLTILCGTASGADALGEKWAIENGAHVEYYRPDWDRYGKAAGPRRNLCMAKSADMLVAFWDGESRGTRNMIQTGLNEGLEVHVFPYKPPHKEGK